MINAYLAGPDVFLPQAGEHAARKVAICRRYGINGRTPLNEDVQSLQDLPDDDAWRAIFRKDLAMMRECDVIIANLTPFRGASADAGTLIEVGWFLGQDKPAFGYSNTAADFTERSRRQVAAIPDPLPGLTVGGFGLPDNLMIQGALFDRGGCPMLLPGNGRDRPFDSLEPFERCVAVVAQRMQSARS